jgi:hypothetical protein
MFCRPCRGDTALVIQIKFLRLEPPGGWVRKLPGEGAEVRFSGWVGLLQAVFMLAHDQASTEAPGRLGGELGA